MAGRTPKPTALKLITGNPGKRSLNKQEPDPTYLQDLTPPAWLPQFAAKVWDEIAPPLSAAKLLTEVDVPMLAKGCVAIAQYRLATIRLGEALVLESEVIEEDGQPVKKAAQLNQWMVAQSMAFKQAMAILQQFGMSPAARSRVAIQPQGDLFGNAQGTGGYFT
jgi:P27 family predicted phage terminase small subunit